MLARVWQHGASMVCQGQVWTTVVGDVLNLGAGDSEWCRICDEHVCCPECGTRVRGMGQRVQRPGVDKAGVHGVFNGVHVQISFGSVMSMHASIAGMVVVTWEHGPWWRTWGARASRRAVVHVQHDGARAAAANRTWPRHPLSFSTLPKRLIHPRALQRFTCVPHNACPPGPSPPTSRLSLLHSTHRQQVYGTSLATAHATLCPCCCCLCIPNGICSDGASCTIVAPAAALLQLYPPAAGACPLRCPGRMRCRAVRHQTSWFRSRTTRP